MKFIITFGEPHCHNGIPMMDYYVEVDAESRAQAVHVANTIFKDQWSHCTLADQLPLRIFAAGCHSRYLFKDGNIRLILNRT